MAATPAETNNTKPTCKGHHEYVFSRCQVRYENSSQVYMYTPKQHHLMCTWAAVHVRQTETINAYAANSLQDHYTASGQSSL